MKQAIIITVILGIISFAAVGAETLDSVLDRYINAVGGEQRLSEIKTLSIKMEIDYGTGVFLKSGMYFDTEKGQVQTYITDSSELTISGTIGNTTWHLTQTGNEIVPEEQGTMLSLQEFICPAFEYKKQNLELFYNGIVSDEYITTHEIIAFDPVSSDTTRLYFDTETGLLVRINKVGYEMTISEYKPVDGILMYHLYEIISDLYVSTNRITSIALNEPIPSKYFAIPDDIKSQLDKNVSEIPTVVVKNISRDDLISIYRHRFGGLSERLERIDVLSKDSDDQMVDEKLVWLRNLNKEIEQLLKSASSASDKDLNIYNDSIATALDRFESGIDDFESHLD